jgi:SAM-dependent methyltransferase
MGSNNEREYLSSFLREFPMKGWIKSLDSGRILNIGSAKIEGSDSFYEREFLNRKILGIDMAPGKGVDIVCDITGSCKELSGEKFAVVLCCSILEHCEKPWIAAANIQNLLMPGGLLYVTVPWVWRTHRYPKDYWRMSPDAIRSLFPYVTWKRVAHSTQGGGEFIPGDQDHDDASPWRIVHRGRSYIAVQMTHMIGRMS